MEILLSGLVEYAANLAAGHFSVSSQGLRRQNRSNHSQGLGSAFPIARASCFENETENGSLVNTPTETVVKPKANAGTTGEQQVFTYPRNYLGNRFVYLTISARARGLSIGVNLNPDRQCNFDCVYCEVERRIPPANATLDLSVLATELESTVALVTKGRLREQSPYSHMPPELLRLRHVAISGDGEPTLCPCFRAAIETVVHVRATSRGPFFKIVLITNSSNLDAPEVQSGLRLFTLQDEVWAKLDAGTQAQMNLLNKAEVPIEKILSNILVIARQRPVVIQSLFPALDGHAPSEQEIERYAHRLKELMDAGGRISLVQIYSATRPTVDPQCGHLPLQTLSRIAQTVRSRTGLNVEVF
jgi:wyosine [tRNA(Phe)-imidazoG37] synthetase (radical SAM superfamily)